MVTLTVNTNTLAEKLYAAIIDKAEKQMIPAVGNALAEIIKRKSALGQDADYGAMKQYTPSYAKKRSRMHLQVQPPNLYVTGNLMSSLKWYPEEKKVTVSSDENAIAHGNLRWRMFLAVSPNDIPALKQVGINILSEAFR